MNENNQNEPMNKQETNQAIKQFLPFVILAFINYLLIGFNASWLFGLQFSPLYATVLSIIFLRFGIPAAVVGYILQQTGVLFPIFPLNVP